MAKRKKVEEIRALNIKPFIKMIAKEKDLEPDIIKSAVESAIFSAAVKRAHSFKEPRPDLDLETGDLRLFVKKTVVMNVEDARTEVDILAAKAKNPEYMLGDEVEIEIDPEEFGRIAAQSVRQGILQRLRDAERDHVFEDFKDKIGSVVTGIVQRYERRDCIVALGKVECLLPHHEIPMGVRYRFGDRIRCLIVDVRRTPKGPQVILSRTRSELVKQLFATEVPEISDGTVRIVEIAREPGVRTKIAVSSMNPDVDPVGACVGLKGSRVQMIVRELDNEKVDIVPYSAMPETFIASALNPAKIVVIKLNEIERRAYVVVEHESLAKAIGKRGQNAKLAAKLTGWKIDVTEQEDEEELARLVSISQQYLMDFLSQIEGLSEFMRDAMAKTNELNSVEKLAEASPEQLLTYTQDDQELAEDIIEGAKEYMTNLREMTEKSEAGMTEELRERLRAVSTLADRLAGRKPEEAPAAEETAPAGESAESSDAAEAAEPEAAEPEAAEPEAAEPEAAEPEAEKKD
ncbi:MAG: transcription termination/antitermination protein NusA [Candidatus Sumerlaeota bacterium]|nr:transcription termination/antitermination protein NusA [Candidatus Sumerlaeota bacterium]